MINIIRKIRDRATNVVTLHAFIINLEKHAMSEGIQLSQELISKIMETIAEHDAEAKHDPIIAMQYMAAINGYLCADYPGPDSERDELLEHLSEFSRYVCNESIKGQQQDASPEAATQPDLPKGKSIATDDPAVGIWKPE